MCRLANQRMTVERTLQHFIFEDAVRIAKETAFKDRMGGPTIIVGSNEKPVIKQLPELTGTRAHMVKEHHFFSAGLELARGGEITDLEQICFICKGCAFISKEDRSFVDPCPEDSRWEEMLLIYSLQIRERQSKLTAYEICRDLDGHLTGLTEFEVEKHQTNVLTPLLKAFILGFEIGVRGRSNHPDCTSDII